MAPVPEIPRQLAPTMGWAATSAGVTFRAGPFTPSGERVAHGLVVRYGAFDCVNDNARHLENADFPVDGSIIAFSSHRIYVAVATNSYPTKVLS
ncbi:DNA mismatch repair protein Mlh1 [Hordeum vulgare]|nr:DNA mismatch repair protein Mlh1 [Hordeum vulgare]